MGLQTTLIALGGSVLGFAAIVAGWDFLKPDDPAILSCEAAVSTVGPDAKYRRLDAKIEKTIVRINYETKLGADRPERREQVCWFQYDEANGEFRFTPRPIDPRCPELMNKPRIGRAEREMFDICVQLEAAIERQFSLLEQAVKGRGIYPIRSIDTRLGR